jgi:mRNA interferase MazF
MRRGEVWTAAGGPGYAGKPRPVVVVQDDRFDATESVTVCGFTTDPADAPLFRLMIEPAEENGLQAPSRLMVDRLADTDMLRLNRAIVVFLGLAGR